MKKRMQVFCAMLLVAVLLAGCGSSGGAGGSGGDGSGAGGSGGAGASEPSRTVNLAISENCITLDPQNANNQGSQIVAEPVYEGLLQTDGEGNYWPWLAKSWEYDETGTVWTFHLREGVTFNNGDPFTSADVVCSYQRLIDNYNELCYSIQYWPGQLLQSVEAVDEYTAVITLKEAYSMSEYGFAKCAIIPASVYGEQGADMFYTQNLVATGPWMLEEWIDGQYAHYVKNPTYWNAANYNSYYDEMYIRHVLESSTSVAGHLAGDLDANLVTGGINPDMLPLYAGSEDRIEIVPVDVFSYYYMGFQCDPGKPLSDVNVRKAFECAIDRQTILDSILGGGKVCKSIIPEGSVGYDENLPPYEYNPELAKEYLAKSNYNGEEIVLSSNTSTTKAEEQLLAISDMLNAVGFNTSVSVVENATLLEMRKTANYDVFLVITMQTGGDPGGILSMRVLEDAHSSHFVDDELNSLIQQGLKTIETEERAGIYKQAMERMREVSAPHTGLYAPYANYAVNFGVKGLDLYRDGTLRLAYVDYDASQTSFTGVDYAALTAGL